MFEAVNFLGDGYGRNPRLVLDEGAIKAKYRGTTGQYFGMTLPSYVDVELNAIDSKGRVGGAQDAVGMGLSGGTLRIHAEDRDDLRLAGEVVGLTAQAGTIMIAGKSRQ